MQRLQKLMIGNALLVILAAMLAGFMLGFGLIGGLELLPGKIVEMPYYGTTEGWARAHSGGVTNGLLIIGVALAMPLIPLGAGMQKLTAYGFIYIGWANTVFYWFGNAAANRALSFGDNPLGPTNLAGAVGFGAALVGAILIVWLLGYAGVRALRGGDAASD
jgi:styrene-oxide isomerase